MDMKSKELMIPIHSIKGMRKIPVSLFCFHTNFRNDESESFVPDYEELEVVTEVYTEVSIFADMNGD